MKYSLQLRAQLFHKIYFTSWLPQLCEVSTFKQHFTDGGNEGERI